MTDEVYRRQWPEAANRLSRQVVYVQPLRETPWKRFIKAAWDPKKQEVFGRNAKSWGWILLFYFVFYFVIAIFFALFLAFFCEVVISKDIPFLYGEDIGIKDNPGMGFRPMPDWETTLIRYDQSSRESMKILANHMTAFLNLYENENQVGRNYIDCADGKRSNNDPEKVCRFDPAILGGKCTHVRQYGYIYGTPCVLLKLNKVVGWAPQPYNASNVPKELGNKWRKDYVGITCDGVTPMDKENIGDIEFFPRDGFPFVYFPYWKQEGYRAPLVMAYFKNIRMGMAVMIECKAWAANIRHSSYDFENAGSVRFELMVD